MWTTIKNFHSPATPVDAWQAAREEGSTLIAGGTYLVADRPPGLHTLVNIRSLLPAEIAGDDNVVELGAGVTLQQLAADDTSRLGGLAKVAEQSCASVNIRSQRTLGGEVAHGRTDSDLMVLLHALKARLTLMAPEPVEVALEDWDNQGLIGAMRIERGGLTNMATERFALLPSARPFVVVAGARYGDRLHLAAGGSADRISRAELGVAGLEKAQLVTISQALAEPFKDDHYGSREYKQALIETAVGRIRERLC